jgi:hypothetical protein
LVFQKSVFSRSRPRSYANSVLGARASRSDQGSCS